MRTELTTLNQRAWYLVEAIAQQELGDGRCHGRLVEISDCQRCSKILTARQLITERLRVAGELPPRPAPEEPTSERQSER